MSVRAATVIMAVSMVPAVSLLADTLEIWASPMLPSRSQPFAATSSSVVVFSKAANFPERLVICAFVAHQIPLSVAYPARRFFYLCVRDVTPFRFLPPLRSAPLHPTAQSLLLKRLSCLWWHKYRSSPYPRPAY